MLRLPTLKGEAVLYTYREAQLCSGCISFDVTSEEKKMFWDEVKSQITTVYYNGFARPVGKHYPCGLPAFWDNKSLLWFPEEKIAVFNNDWVLYIGSSIITK